MTSRVGGGAKVLRNRDLVEIDPSGVVGFSENSLNYSVDYSVNEVPKTVSQRAFSVILGLPGYYE